jgi:hypothetical protein
MFELGVAQGSAYDTCSFQADVTLVKEGSAVHLSRFSLFFFSLSIFFKAVI